MLLSRKLRAPVPLASALSASPFVELPLGTLPVIAWAARARHGGAAREDYVVPGAWCLHLYEWSGALTVQLPTERVTLPVQPGFISLIPPGTLLAHHFAGQRTQVQHLTAGFFLQPSRNAADRPTIPLMRDASHAHRVLVAAFERAVAAWPAGPGRAGSALLELLWQIAELPQPNGPAIPEDPRVAAMLRYINLALGAPDLAVPAVCKAGGLSETHGLRLFKRHTGRGIKNFIRWRRVALAGDLLSNTTAPVATIAAQAGFRDVQALNKAVRAERGVPPTALRRT